MEVSLGDKAVTVAGDPVGEAQNRPLAEADVRKQFSKTGGSGYELELLEIEMDPDVFLPVGAMNRLRREALECLTKERLDDYKRVD